MRKNLNKRSAARRALYQPTLDYINKHPGCTAPTIIKAMGWKRSNGGMSLLDMILGGELRRMRVSAHAPYKYWALCSEVKTEVANSLNKLNRDRSNAMPVPRAASTGYFCNDPTKHKPHPKQGGQGVSRVVPRGRSSLP